MSQEHSAGADIPQSSEIVLGDSVLSRSEIGMSYTNVMVLKRRVSSSFESFEQDANRKRLKEQIAEVPTHMISDESILMTQGTFADNLAEELNCGCCSSVCFRPVVVFPCQHFFCGSCCVLWIRSGGSNCPACRGVATSVMPSRPLQAVIDLLVRTYPSKQRPERERIQADEVYIAGTSLHIPTPREASPEPNLNQSTEFARPCAHCSPNNPFGWRCPHPIPDPNTDPDRAWHVNNGTPPGHAYCGNCENILACRAPTTTKCDFCQVSFCGVGIQGRCVASPLQSQHPHGMTDVTDLIQSSEVYECFDSNTVEVEYLLDYVVAQRLTPRHIYREIVVHIQSQQNGFKALFESELFVDIHGVAAGVDPNPDAPRNKICRLCATEVLLFGLKEWWIRERRKGFVDERVSCRKDCLEGTACTKQKDPAHAKEFNHIISTQSESLDEDIRPNLSTATNHSLQDTPDLGSSASNTSVLRNVLLPAAFNRSESGPSSSQDLRDAVDALTRG